MTTVTISCRVTPNQKLALIQRAEKLGIKLCNYVELLVLRDFDNMQQESKETEKETIPITIDAVLRADSPTAANIFEKYMEELQERYPDYSETELLNACLIHAFSNHKAWHQKSLTTFLKKLKQGQYEN